MNERDRAQCGQRTNVVYRLGSCAPVSHSTRPVYQRLHSLPEAQSYPDGVLAMWGDGSGRVYVVAPASRV